MPEQLSSEASLQLQICTVLQSKSSNSAHQRVQDQFALIGAGKDAVVGWDKIDRIEVIPQFSRKTPYFPASPSPSPLES
eukprot:2044485-Rhodomonas_salina.1